MACTFELEKKVGASKYFRVAGIDEVGRGSLAGPIIACAAILSEDLSIPGIDDSKKLRPAKRKQLYKLITESSEIVWAIALQDNQAVDRLNVSRATYKAMYHAVTALQILPEYALIDGSSPVPKFPVPHTSIIRGDQLSLSIAVASIIAKVARDHLMITADTQYPLYGFCRHKGYGTVEHLEKLRKYGPCPLHRLTFSPVRKFL